MATISATTAITTAVVMITIVAMIIAIRTIRRHVSMTASMTIIVKIPAITILVISKTLRAGRSLSIWKSNILIRWLEFTRLKCI